MQSTKQNPTDIDPAKFIKQLTKGQLREFLCRIASVDKHIPSVFSNMLMNELQTQYSDIFKQYTGLHIHTRVNESPHYKNPSDIYAIVAFTNKQLVTQRLQTGKVTAKTVDAPIGHITFHMICEQCGSNTGRSPFHAINDRSTRKVQKIHVSRKHMQTCCKHTLKLDTNTRLAFTLDADMQTLSAATLNLINTWFEPQHSQNLSQPMCSQDAIDNVEQYLETIVEWKTKSGGNRKRQTRKRKRHM